jgi:predicted nuclease of predicted toxin-antitoxin system
MKIVIDVNRPPRWVEVLQHHGIDSVHWTSAGGPRATDREIMEWAPAHEHVVFTHDLDFGALLAMTHATGPSVIQVRTQDVFPEATSRSS